MSGGFVLLYAYALFNQVAGLIDSAAEQGLANQVLGQVLGVLATMTRLAYDPPKAVKGWLGDRHTHERRMPDLPPVQRPRA